VRLVTYESNGAWRAGLALDDTLIDAEAAARAAGLDDRAPAEGGWSSNRNLVQADQHTRAALMEAATNIAAEQGLALETAALGPPILDPEKILCMGLNYRDHAEETRQALPEVPLFFAKFRNSLVGPADEVVIPAASDKIDYEAELAIVIGRRCRGLSAERALDYVGGAMAFDDVSARDLQVQSSQWTLGKAIDTFAPCGPALVTLDEISDLQALGIRTRVNGETLQDANTSLMVFTVAEAIAHLTKVMTLEPGDIIATGTPAGVGQSRDPQVWLHDGDVVEVEIDGIGTLRNPVRG
jgi:2-keto-4-pentenoate hydratase/2-oxohepta-3-ene-1,7-dioic acid hydratase in catechol pathway